MIITIETTALGDRSYLLVDGSRVAVVDPQRDIDRVERILADQQLRVTHVLETHVHNDYVSGGLELARRTGATNVVPAGDEVAYERTSARDGDEFQVGALALRAVHTPGHTPHHLSYVVVDRGRPVAAFTGGSMLYGTVGRTDLLGDAVTDELTRAQFHSVRRLARELPDDVELHPTHGFGSFCSSTSTSGSATSTIAQERRSNVALTLDDEEAFVERLLGGFTAYPRYYAHMGPINRHGPSPVDLSGPEAVDPAEVRRRIHDGEWVVDLRSREAFARGHLAGTLNLEIGDSFATYLGWTLPWGTPVTLVGDSLAEVAEAQRQMVRIGIDRPAGAADGGVTVWGAGGEIRTYKAATFADLADAADGADLAEAGTDAIVVLDVRRDDEWEEGYIEGAVHIPLHDLSQRVDDLPRRPIWVHCASGYRAALAASMLDRAGHDVVVIDDEWEEAAKHDGLHVATFH